MKITKIRRIGNDNVLSLPRELEAIGYVPDSSVLIEELPDGGLRISQASHVRERIKDEGRRLVDEHPEALRILGDDQAAS